MMRIIMTNNCCLTLNKFNTIPEIITQHISKHQSFAEGPNLTTGSKNKFRSQDEFIINSWKENV